MVLTEKETMYLNEFASQEELCIKKYSYAAEKACDEQLKQLFKQIESDEEKHLDAVNQMLSGKTPSVPASKKPESKTFNESSCSASAKETDKFLCTDMLTGEKHTSSTYNTGVFEFRDENARMMLNHIETEEQNHGKMLYDYMSRNSMY